MGAHHVVDHRQPLAKQVNAIVPGGVNYVLALTKAEDYWDEIVECLSPQGALGLIENVAAVAIRLADHLPAADSAAIRMRSAFSPSSRYLKPLPSSPMRFSTGTSRSSINSSVVA